MSFKRMGFLDAARSYPALLSVRSPVPELKDHVRSVSQRDSRGYPFTVSTIIATPIPEMAECGSRNGHRHALDLWRPKYVITLVPPVAQRACTALGSRRQRSAQRSQRYHGTEISRREKRLRSRILLKKCINIFSLRSYLSFGMNG